MATEGGLAARVRDDTERFKAGFLQAGAVGMGSAAFLVLLASVVTKPDASTALVCIAGLTSNAAAAYLARNKQVRLGSLLLIYQTFLSSGASIWAGGAEGAMSASMVPLAMLLIPLAGLLLGGHHALVVAVSALVLTGRNSWLAVAAGQPVAAFAVNFTYVALMLGVEVLAVVLMMRHFTSNQDVLSARMEDLERFMESARRIARGDLSGKVEGQGDAAQVVQGMLDGLRTMVGDIRKTSSTLAAATTEIAAMTRQQEAGSQSQAAAVQEIRATLESLLKSSANVADSTQQVFESVERTQHTNEIVAQRIGALISHTRRMAEILDLIKDVANKAEILALNASLEGARAGEAGRGFSLVANQMQRLAESVMAAVTDVKELTLNIREATSATVASTEEGTKQSSGATLAARQISVITQQQRSSTEQVTRAMNDIAEVTRQVTAGTSQTQVAVRDLAKLADQLNGMVTGFQL